MAPETRETLRERILNLEAYGRREDLLRAFEWGDYTAASALCREAMKEAAHRARYNCAPIGPEAHKRNFDALRELRAAIRKDKG